MKNGKITSEESKLVRRFLAAGIEKQKLYFNAYAGLGIPEGKVVRVTIEFVDSKDADLKEEK